VPVVEVGLAGVDRDDREAFQAEHRVALAEDVLEVDVADVPGVVVAGDHDHRLALDLVEVLAGEAVLLLEAEDREVAGADDGARLELVDLGDRALEQARLEARVSAVQVGDVGDREGGPAVGAHPCRV
jgi:hypothetical protein